MATTIVFLVLAFAPALAGFLAAVVGVFASMAVSAACEATAFDSGESAAAEWCTELSSAIDVDAEWCALSDQADLCDALDAAETARAYAAHVQARHAFLCSVRVGIALSRARIVRHYTQASAGTPNVQGNCDLTRILDLAIDRQWREDMLDFETCEAPRDYLVDRAVDVLSSLAMWNDDPKEHATCTRLSVEKYQRELRESFDSSSTLRSVA